MAFTKKNMIFNTNREQNLPLWIVYCYLASGTYETWNPLGNACIQAMYVVWSQLALQIIQVSNFRHASWYSYFIVSQTFWIMLRSGLWAVSTHSALLKQCILSSWKIKGQFSKCWNCSVTIHINWCKCSN